MEVKGTFKPYFHDIEAIIIENIQKASISIKIAMAWFTCQDIKDALVTHLLRNPDVTAELILDNNERNDKSIRWSASDFRRAGVIIHKPVQEFLHHKFMIIDGRITIMGSYNYSVKARSSLESIVECDSEEFSAVYNRVFKFLTVPDYIDQNVSLLMKYPEFSQKLLSVYYPFSETGFLKCKPLLVPGHCFTYDYGNGDMLRYEPGYLFNKNLDLKAVKNQEFKLPITKDAIQSWQINNSQLAILDYFNGQEDLYHLINEELDSSKDHVIAEFNRTIKSTHTSDVIETMIQNDIDIIIEDRLWSDNFALFLNKSLVQLVLEEIRNMVKTKRYLDHQQ